MVLPLLRDQLPAAQYFVYFRVHRGMRNELTDSCTNGHQLGSPGKTYRQPGVRCMSCATSKGGPLFSPPKIITAPTARFTRRLNAQLSALSSTQDLHPNSGSRMPPLDETAGGHTKCLRNPSLIALQSLSDSRAEVLFEKVLRFTRLQR